MHHCRLQKCAFIFPPQERDRIVLQAATNKQTNKMDCTSGSIRKKYMH